MNNINNSLIPNRLEHQYLDIESKRAKTMFFGAFGDMRGAAEFGKANNIKVH
jgi:hypothetical protein